MLIISSRSTAAIFIFSSALAISQCYANESPSQPAKNFDGLSVQAAVGYQPYSIRASKIGIQNTNIVLPDRIENGSSTPYFAGLTYTAAISDRTTLAIQAEVNPINQQYVLSVLPGYAFSSDAQAYFKLAWVNALVTVNQSSMQSRLDATVNGVTAGFGIKKLFTKNWYGFAEANYVKMNTFKFQSSVQGIPITGSADYSGFNVMAGIGYLF